MVFKALENMNFNGIDLATLFDDDGGHDSYVLVNNVSGRDLTNVENDKFTVSRMDGDYSSFSRVLPRPLIVTVTVKGESRSDLMLRLERLNDVFYGEKEDVPIVFDDEPERIYFGKVDGLELIEETDVICKFNVLIHCSDPYKYSKEEITTEVEDVVMVNNEGNEPTPPIIELTAKKKATFLMVNNLDDEYNLLGYPLEEEGNEEEVEQKPVVFYEDGTSTDQWTSTGAEVDDYFNDITGSITSDGAGIRASTYGGAGERMHGPAVITTLPESLTDFEIKTNFDIISRRDLDNFRIEVYMFDEAMNMLGKIGIKDNSRTQNRRAALGRVGEYRGAGRKNGYAIGKHNYLKDNLGETTLMHMSVKREGNLYSFYVARYRNARHQSTLRSSLRDSANEYGGKLKYIGLFIGNYKDRSSPNRLRMNNLKVTEIRKITEDQTPYIIEEGDEIILDHEAESVFVNGEGYMPLRVFGSDFFHLQKGYNQLEINPPDTFDGVIKHREKYK